MEFSFLEALEKLGRNAAFRIVNEARPSSDYYFETLLPERRMSSYYVESGFMTIRATMAGMVAMDSPYPPGGAVEVSKFLEKSAKIALHNKLTEAALREMQEILREMGLAGAPRTDFIANEALNFLEKVILQGMMDTDEWLRAQCLIYGKLDWQFNDLDLQVDYGVPASHFLPARAGNDRYNANHVNNKFWEDHYAALKLLRYNVRAIVAHTDTVLQIVNTDQLKLDVSQSGSVFTLRRYRTRGNGEVISSDSRDSLTIVAYDGEGEVLDPADTSKTKRIQFVPDGKLLYVGNNRRTGYRVGEGSTPDPVRDMALGYHHMAPTVESGGTPGRWSKLFTPEMQPWELHGMGAENSLPVREDVSGTEAKTVTLTTALA
jgi:hypothetical protein